MFRPLLGALAVLTAVVAGPAQSQTPAQSQAPRTTISGVAGSYTLLTLTHPFAVSDVFRGVTATASRGDFLGIAFVSPHADHWLTWTRGLAEGTNCAFGPGCDAADFPGVSGSDLGDQGYEIPAGTYRVALLGRPGAAITITTTIAGRSGHLATTRVAHLQVTSPAGVFPTAGSAQPEASGSATFANTGPTVVGGVVRVDTSYGYQDDIGFCFADGTSPLPQADVCGGGGFQYYGSEVLYQNCEIGVPGLYCAPIGAPSDAVTVTEAQVLTSGASVGYDVTAQAVHSRVAPVLYAIWF